MRPKGSFARLNVHVGQSIRSSEHGCCPTQHDEIVWLESTSGRGKTGREKRQQHHFWFGECTAGTNILSALDCLPTMGWRKTSSSLARVFLEWQPRVTYTQTEEVFLCVEFVQCVVSVRLHAYCRPDPNSRQYKLASSRWYKFSAGVCS